MAGQQGSTDLTVVDPSPSLELDTHDDVTQLREAGESDLHWAWFVFWLDLKPGMRMRSAVAEHFNTDAEGVKKVAYQYRWKTRAQQWDILVHTRSLERQAAEHTSSQSELREAGHKLMQKISRRLDELSDKDLARMGPRDLALWADAADRIHRTLFGDASLANARDKAAAVPSAPGSTINFNGPTQINEAGMARDDVVGRLAPFAETLRALAAEQQAHQASPEVLPEGGGTEDLVQ